MNIPKIATLLFGAALCMPAVAQSPSGTTAPRTGTTAPTTAPSTTAPRGASAPAASAPASQSKLVDINSASLDELDKLPGIGKARAGAIIKNRPYRGKDELASRRIIPQNVYDQIKDKIIARQG